MFIKIDALKAELSSLRSLSKGEVDRLREEFIIGLTYNSNAIEGSSITLRETALILKEGVTIAGKPLSEHLDAIGFCDAFRFILDFAERSSELSEHDLMQLHSLVLMHDAQNRGRYRRVPVRVLGSLHLPPLPYDVPGLMSELLSDLRRMETELHPVALAAEFHMRFEAIHPFIDGNGRLGRLLLNLQLIQGGFLPVDIKFSDRDRYYRCFDDYHSGAESTMLAELITELEAAELQTYLGILKEAQ